MTQITSPFLRQYVQDASAQLGALLGRQLTEDEIETIKHVASTRVSDRKVVIENPYMNRVIPTTLLKVVDLTRERPSGLPIVTGHGTLFRPHGEHQSVIGDMVRSLMDNRKVEKNAMFDLMRAGRPHDDPEVKAKDQAQKIWKLLANSFYGAMGEKGFLFFDPQNGPATTYNGQLIISSTLYGFETLMEGNAWLENPAELFRHVAMCVGSVEPGESPEDEWGPHPRRDELVSREEVAKQLRRACSPDWDCTKAVETVMAMLPDSALWALALRGRPQEFMEFEEAGARLDIAMNGEIREADPGKLAKHHPEGKVAIEEIWSGWSKWVAYPEVPGDLPRRVGTMTRHIVVLTDTDSTFLNLGPWMEMIGRMYDRKTFTEENDLTALNVAVYLLRLFNDRQMAKLTADLNVPEDKRKLINFKSEFVISRMVLTDGKKHYAALLRFQEGARIVGDKVELKGLAMKKTTVARVTGEFFEEVVENRVLRAQPTVDRIGTVSSVLELEAHIRKSTVEDGSTEFSSPGVFARMSDYQNPYSMPVVRGRAAYNAAFPDAPIREGDRVNMFRIRVGTDANLLADEIDRWPEGSSERAALEAVAKAIFGTDAPQELQENGFNWLALPKELGSIPEWARRLVDLEEVISANVSPILPILASIGTRVLARPDPRTYSTCLQL